MSMAKRAILAVVLGGALFSGCATGGGAPKSFQKLPTQSWVAIEVREGLDYDRAWDTALDLIVKNFEIEKALRGEGYIRTGWLHSWSGEYLSNYRVRISVKFSPDHTQLRFLPEAQLLTGENWTIGIDNRLVAAVKADLMGTIGRIAR